jgi:hypothetical protein
LTVVSSAQAGFLIWTIAVAILKPAAAFLPLPMETPLFDTVAPSTAAVFVFPAECRYALEPVRYRALALKALAISLLPEVALAMLDWFGGRWPEALDLMAMHVAVWAIWVTMLPGLVATKSQYRETLGPIPRAGLETDYGWPPRSVSRISVFQSSRSWTFANASALARTALRMAPLTASTVAFCRATRVSASSE